MNLKTIFSLSLVSLFAGVAFAQHSDIEFGYENGSIFFESDGPGINAAGVFESEFEIFPMDGTKIAEDPGFASNFMEGMETFEVANGDSIFVNVNQSAHFGGFLTYFNPLSGEFESTNATFTIQDNSPMVTSDLVVSEGGLAGDLSQFVVTSDGSEIDSHVDFVLSSGAADGAYGLLLNIESDNASGELTDATSEAFWVVFNNGLDKDVFESAVGRFTVVPEPGSAGVIAIGLLFFARRKRS